MDGDAEKGCKKPDVYSRRLLMMMMIGLYRKCAEQHIAWHGQRRRPQGRQREPVRGSDGRHATVHVLLRRLVRGVPRLQDLPQLQSPRAAFQVRRAARRRLHLADDAAHVSGNPRRPLRHETRVLPPLRLPQRANVRCCCCRKFPAFVCISAIGLYNLIFNISHSNEITLK